MPVDEPTHHTPENSSPLSTDGEYISSEHMRLPDEISRKKINPSNKTKNIFKQPPKLLLIVLVLLIIAAAWFLVPSKDGDNQLAEPSNEPQQKQSAPQTTANAASLGDLQLTETYKNDFLRLSFNHPKAWGVKDEQDVVLLSSPVFSYKTVDGSDKQGFFKIYIKQSSTPTDGKYLGRGIVISQSEKIAYSQPEPSQRTETYITPFGLDGVDNFAYFVVQGNFNLAEGDSLGPKFASETDAFLIAGGFSSEDQKDPLGMNRLSPDSYKNEQAYKSAVEIIKSLKLN
jgi:hypothetical protein